MEFLTEKKDRLKSKVNKLYQSYGHLCAKNPLPMIASSVVIVLICSLPLLSHPVFERTATFIFGRIQLGKYKTNISLSSTRSLDKSTIIVQQIKFNINVSVLREEGNFQLERWKIFQKVLHMSGVGNMDHFCKNSQSFNWTSICLHVSRKPFYKSPQTRLIYPRGRFYKELKKWFSISGCLNVSPVTFLALNERRFWDLPEQFKELLVGYPATESGLHTREEQDTVFHFTLSLFLKKHDKSFSASLKEYFESKENTSTSLETVSSYRIRYLPTEEDNDMELILLSVTYVLVFFYILFSVGKINMLKSRWGLAFSAVMTIIMSMMMALGLCASLDLLPTVLTITEIFPYVVIVIGLENVLTITKSVMSTDGDMDVSTKVAKGMGKEGWYITKNLVAELTILGAGYFTLIPSLQEFCTFAFVGVLSDFFIQMVFFAPVLAVDIRRAELCHLEQITIGQQFAVGFNLMQKTALTLVPPSPPKSLRSKYFEKLCKMRRVVQKVLMMAVAFYIIYAVYNKVQDEKNGTAIQRQKGDNDIGDMKSPKTDSPKSALVSHAPRTENSSARNQHANGLGSEASSSQSARRTASWEFLSKHHWPELLTFYHIPFNEKSLLILPTIQVKMNITMDKTEPYQVYQFTATSRLEELLLVAVLAVFSCISIALIWFIFFCLSKRRRRPLICADASIYEMSRVVCRGHKSCIESIQADDKQQHIVTTTLAGVIRVWETHGMHCVMEISLNNRKSRDQNKTSFTNLRRRHHSDSRRFSAVENPCPTCSVWCLDCKHSLLAVAFSTGIIKVYNINGRKLIASLQEEKTVVDLKIASRNTIIIGRIDGIIDIVAIHRSQLDSVEDTESSQAFWQISADDNDDEWFGARTKHRIKAHIGPIEHLLVSSGNAFCLSADILKVYEIDDANCCNSLSLNDKQATVVHQIKQINGLAMAIGLEDGCIMIINSSGEKTAEYHWHQFLILAICSNSNFLASLDVDQQISIWSSNGELQCSIVQNVPCSVYAIHFLNSVTLCTLSQDSGCLYYASDGCLLKKVDIVPDYCNGITANLVCYPENNSLALAKGTFFELINFPKLSELEAEGNVDR